MNFSKSILIQALSVLMVSSAIAMPKAKVGSKAKKHSDESHVDEFMRIRKEQNDYYESLQRAIDEGRPVNVGAGNCKYISNIFRPPVDGVVSLTFDDGPSPTLTPKLLDVLKKYQVKATFFVLGQSAKSNLAIIQRAKDEGHLISSHSWNHPNFHSLTDEQRRQQVLNADNVIREYMEPVKLFRYPYGNSNCASNDYIKSLGYSGILGWHVDSCDWAFAKNGKVTSEQAKICGVAAANQANYEEHVISKIESRRGGIVLMHDVHARTLASVEKIIIRLQKSGYSFVNLDDGSMTQFYAQ